MRISELYMLVLRACISITTVDCSFHDTTFEFVKEIDCRWRQVAFTWSREKLGCSTFIGFFACSGTCWILFFVMTRSSLVHFEITGFGRRDCSSGCPTIKSLCYSSELTMLGLQSFSFSKYCIISPPSFGRGCVSLIFGIDELFWS